MKEEDKVVRKGGKFDPRRGQFTSDNQKSMNKSVQKSYAHTIEHK